jgi:hypothetical protein
MINDTAKPACSRTVDGLESYLYKRTVHERGDGAMHRPSTILWSFDKASQSDIDIELDFDCEPKAQSFSMIARVPHRRRNKDNAATRQHTRNVRSGWVAQVSHLWLRLSQPW